MSQRSQESMWMTTFLECANAQLKRIVVVGKWKKFIFLMGTETGSQLIRKKPCMQTLKNNFSLLNVNQVRLDIFVTNVTSTAIE